MKKTARKINATTQRFVGIEDIIEDVVILPGSQACMVLEITATNFSLQSIDEQKSRILSYGSFLNSLSYPIQILVVSRKLDISSYIRLLDNEQQKTSNPRLGQQIKLYKEFVEKLVQVNTVLDKKFYIVVSFSFLEKGAGAVASIKDKKGFFLDARNLLHSKATSVSQELQRVGLKSKILKKDELISLYYEIFNTEEGHSVSGHETSPFVGGIK